MSAHIMAYIHTYIPVVKKLKVRRTTFEIESLVIEYIE